ncbi:hypothetical protein, partial [Escherichia coli]|uniref:hypothetical protein n=1 Tax=Escherichia coli TaxID=562 RepID=UPI00090791C9
SFSGSLVSRIPGAVQFALPLPDHKMFWFWHTEFGHLSIGNMLTLEQHRCSNEKRKFQRRV